MVISSCKEKNEGQKKIETIENNIKEVEEVKDIKSFLNLVNKPNSIIKDFSFGDNIQINKFNHFRDSLGVSSFIFQIETINSDIDLDKYRINLRITPFSNQNNLLREDSKKSNLNYDSWFSDFKIKNSNSNTKYIVFSLRTDISEFKNIELFLYDKQLKKFIGNKVSIDYEFENYLNSSKKVNVHKTDGILGREFSVSNFKAYMKEGSKGFYVAYQLTDVVPEERFAKKRLMINIFPTDSYQDFLREDSKKNNSSFDSWYYDIKIKEYENSQFLWAYIPTEILDFNKIEAYIYDETQKRFVGLPVILKDVSLDFNK
ncbi:hypothetical protein DIS18_04845 [Algibacter marinivivus]|uniref:Uncharacterized protein n=1 Tax=Algibacter marinivivus TaxID=2100723 RepID=A0A2U2X7Z2_9FLAO|nr:hypothetical protein DIS18_04845 [Algibacter marinivivus]